VEMNGICCVCGHKLEYHLDEGGVWRCHALGPDTYQCECRLLKYLGDKERYDLGSRTDEVLNELR
jgi:hypothetical protein